MLNLLASDFYVISLNLFVKFMYYAVAESVVF